MKRIIFIALTCILQHTAIQARVSYFTSQLKHLAKVIGLDETQLHEGYNYPEISQERFCVHMRGDSVIDHLGHSIFSEDMKKLDNRVVMEFLERYLLQLKYPMAPKTTSMMLRDDDVKIERGSLAKADQLTTSDSYTCNYELMRYRAAWSRNGKELLAISFPGEFELLRGITIIEAERMLENEARRTDAPNSQRILTDPHMLDSTAAEGCYVMRGGFYLNKLLTDDRYYQETKPGTFSLLLTSDHPAESAANLMLCQEISGKRQLDITERLYGFKKKTFSLPLSQWLAFCHHAGCRLYFGVQKISAGSIKATVIAVNDTENYNHVLTAEIPLSTLDDDEGKVSAHLSCYLPMHNVRNLFGQDKTSRKKKLSL